MLPVRPWWFQYAPDPQSPGGAEGAGLWVLPLRRAWGLGGTIAEPSTDAACSLHTATSRDFSLWKLCPGCLILGTGTTMFCDVVEVSVIVNCLNLHCYTTQFLCSSAPLVSCVSEPSPRTWSPLSGMPRRCHSSSTSHQELQNPLQIQDQIINPWPNPPLNGKWEWIRKYLCLKEAALLILKETVLWHFWWH